MERGSGSGASKLLKPVSCIALAAILYACSGSASSQQAQPGPADAGPTDDAATTEIDAAPDPHDIDPADHPPLPEMDYHGGRVLKNPKLVTVTFAGMDTTIRDYLREFDDKLLTTPWWTTVMDGYGVGPGKGIGYVELPDTFSGNTTSDEDLKAWIAHQIQAGTLPFPDDDTVYMLYMPSGASIDLDGTPSCQGFGGYHNSGEVSLDPVPEGGDDDAGTPEAGIGKRQRFIYAVNMECYSGFGATMQDIKDEETSTASHEIAEAATDPDVNVPGVKAGYYMLGNDAWAPDQRGGEVGDLCEGRGYQEGSYYVTKSWNAVAAKKSLSPCQPDSPIFYGAVPHTEQPGRTVGGSPLADGYVVVKKGEMRDVEVDVFSTAPLPDDLTIVAGRQSHSSSDPTQVVPIKGVTMSLSQPTARNGDKLALTISVSPSASSTSSRFVVRAILDASKKDYHSWPVILYVP